MVKCLYFDTMGGRVDSDLPIDDWDELESLFQASMEVRTIKVWTGVEGRHDSDRDDRSWNVFLTLYYTDCSKRAINRYYPWARGPVFLAVAIGTDDIEQTHYLDYDRLGTADQLNDVLSAYASVKSCEEIALTERFDSRKKKQALEDIARMEAGLEAAANVIDATAVFKNP
jgi:hypothetical protein